MSIAIKRLRASQAGVMPLRRLAPDSAGIRATRSGLDAIKDQYVRFGYQRINSTDIRRATRRHFSAEDTIRIVLDVVRRNDRIAELCRPVGIAQSMCNSWSKEFMEAGMRRLASTPRGLTPSTRQTSRSACQRQLIPQTGKHPCSLGHYQRLS